jgi:hypothetical protein
MLKLNLQRATSLSQEGSSVEVVLAGNIDWQESWFGRAYAGRSPEQCRIQQRNGM